LRTTDFEFAAPPQKPAVIPTIRGLFASLRLNDLRDGVGMIHPSHGECLPKSNGPFRQPLIRQDRCAPTETEVTAAWELYRAALAAYWECPTPEMFKVRRLAFQAWERAFLGACAA